jgi:hypothetical protein
MFTISFREFLEVQQMPQIANSNERSQTVFTGYSREKAAHPNRQFGDVMSPGVALEVQMASKIASRDPNKPSKWHMGWVQFDQISDDSYLKSNDVNAFKQAQAMLVKKGIMPHLTLSGERVASAPLNTSQTGHNQRPPTTGLPLDPSYFQRHERR